MSISIAALFNSIYFLGALPCILIYKTLYYKEIEFFSVFQAVSFSMFTGFLVLLPQALCNLGSVVHHLDPAEDVVGPGLLMALLALNLLALSSWNFATVMYEGNAIETDVVLHILLFAFISVYLLIFGSVYGILTETFKAKCKNITRLFKSGASLEKARSGFEQYLQLKHRSQLGLFVNFTCGTITLVAFTYSISIIVLFSCLGQYKIFPVLAFLGLQTTAFLLNLFYYGWTADECHQAFKGLSAPLRYCYVAQGKLRTSRVQSII